MIKKNKLNFIEKFICKILKAGQIPKHIAFIMDGNRRYAKNLGKDILEGHQYGIEALKKCLLYCAQLHVQTVSLYCFSLQNFNRSEKEVQRLMKLIIQTFDKYSQFAYLLDENDIKVKIIGDLSKFDEDIRKLFDNIEKRTINNKSATVNLCFAYDSLFQINLAKQKNVSYQQFQQKLLVKHPVDLMVRTSNEYRLSNFLLPQSKYCQVCILKQNWPQLGIISFIKIILQYNYYSQRTYSKSSTLYFRQGKQNTQTISSQNILPN